MEPKSAAVIYWTEGLYNVSTLQYLMLLHKSLNCKWVTGAFLMFFCSALDRSEHTADALHVGGDVWERLKQCVTWNMERDGCCEGCWRSVTLFSGESHSRMVRIFSAGGCMCRCVRRAFFRWWKSPSISVYLRDRYSPSWSRTSASSSLSLIHCCFLIFSGNGSLWLWTKT